MPQQIFITDKLPKGATGKIQRRNMAGHFIGSGSGRKDSGSGSGGGEKASGKTPIRSKL